MLTNAAPADKPEGFWCEDCEETFDECHFSDTDYTHLAGARYGYEGERLEQEARNLADASRYRFLRDCSWRQFYPLLTVASQCNAPQEWDKMIDEAIERDG